MAWFRHLEGSEGEVSAETLSTASNRFESVNLLWI